MCIRDRFHVNVTEQQTRQGPTVMMFKKGDIASDDPLSLIEGPPREWLDALMKKYRK